MRGVCQTEDPNSTEMRRDVLKSELDVRPEKPLGSETPPYSEIEDTTEDDEGLAWRFNKPGRSGFGM
ncbi:hypothetical protein TWF696_005769 [Orbilia brochopaga]|uniref:Uncharacterized protein n=1 Tax=Orbilia brochopaga TaxID=3140254 RepID=A0AAV9UU47_9PEZI